MAKEIGRVIQVQGNVVDVVFPEGSLPDQFEALEIQRPGEEPMVLEVEKHLGDNWVRCVSMESTDGLQRGLEAHATGAPIMVPVGEVGLGRIFNLVGDTIDNIPGAPGIGERRRRSGSPGAGQASGGRA